MAKKSGQRSDVSAVRSLAEEVDAAEAAISDSGDGALSTTDLVAIDTAKRLVRSVRHRAEQAEHHEIDERSEDFTEHAFEHKAQIGGFR